MGLAVFQSGLYESHEYGLRILRRALILGMELHSYKERVLRNLHNLHQPGLRIAAAGPHTGLIEPGHIIIVKFITVTVPLAYKRFSRTDMLPDASFRPLWS